MATIASAQSGNWSNTATWTGGVVPGNGDDARIGHAVVIDQNIGTAGNGIRRIHVFGASASLTVDNSAARTITFASTGSDPVGSGTATNPGADATMFGIFAASGVLDLTGTAVNPVTLTSQDDASPIYIHHNWGDVDFGGTTRNNEMPLTLKFCVLKHLGANVDQYRGVDWYSGSTGTPPVTIEDCRFEDCYNALYSTFSRGQYLIRRNDFASTRSSLYVFLGRPCANGSEIVDNTFRATGAITAFQQAWEAIGITIEGNAVRSSSGTAVLRQPNNNTEAGTLNFTARNNLCHGGAIGGTAFRHGGSFAGGAVIDGFACFNADYAVFTTSPASSVSRVFARTGDTTPGAHAPLITSRGTHSFRHCVVVFDATATQNNGFFCWAPDQLDPTIPTVEHCTFVNLGSKAGSRYGISFGNGTAGHPVTSARCRSNISQGWAEGIKDYPGDGTLVNQYADDGPNGVGVHHNATLDNTTDYVRSSGAPWDSNNFDDGTTAHPNAAYGDLSDIDPQFLAPDRTVETWDASLGGPGTLDHAFAELAKRCGVVGGADSAYAIGDLIDYLIDGYRPTNPAFIGTAHDGGTIGATEYIANRIRLLSGSSRLILRKSAP